MKRLSIGKQKDLLAVFARFVEHDPSMALAFLAHCGVEIRSSMKPHEIIDEISSRFRVGRGVYDLGNVMVNLLTFPPVARWLRQTQRETNRAEMKAARKQRRRDRRRSRSALIGAA